MPRHSPVFYDEALVTETLDAIAAERGRFDRSFTLVDDLLARMGETNLAKRLYSGIPTQRPWKDVADLFEILCWSTSDNGSAIMRQVERWLISTDDARLVQIALHLDAYPFLDRGTMERVLCEVAERVPEVGQLCRDRIQSRRRLPGGA
ncbi:MAG: hypothetical protein QM754_07815 [Tepidisphaeraceae bacterium]